MSLSVDADIAAGTDLLGKSVKGAAPVDPTSKVPGRKYTDMQHYQYNQAVTLLQQLKDEKDPETILEICTELESVCDSLSVSLGGKKLSWRINYETTTNEIYVDFR